MQLVSLRIRNFRVMREAQLAFPDALIGIIGPNGAGKSSIIEAISWALYGNLAARSGKDEIKSSFAASGADAEVGLEFLLHGHRYLVIRRLVGRTERPEVEVTCDGRPESVGSAGTREYMERLLGLDWRGFLSSFLARQQELNALSDLAPAKRREHLVGMLGIGRLDKGIQRLKEENRGAEERTATLERLLVGQPQVALRLTALAEQIVGLEREQQGRASAVLQAEQAWRRLADQVREHEEKQQACSRLRVQIQAAGQTREHLERQAANLGGQLVAMDTNRAEHERLRPDLACQPEAVRRMEALRNLKAQAVLRAEVAGQLKRSQTELSQVDSRLGELMSERTRMNDEEAGWPVDLEDRLMQTGAELEAARGEYARLAGLMETLGKDLNRARAQIRGAAEIGPETVCDRCHRPYGDDLPGIRAHLEAELGALTKLEAERKTEQDALRESGKLLKGRVDELQVMAKARSRNRVRSEGIVAEEERLKARRTGLSEQIKRASEQLQKLGNELFDPDQLRRAELDVQRLDRVRQELDRLEGFLAHRPKVEADLTETRNQIGAKTEEQSRLEKELAGVGFDERLFADLVAKRDTAGQQLEQARGAEVAISRDLALARQEQKDRGEEMARMAEAQKELESSRDSLYYGVKLAGLLGEFRKDLIAQIRPRLAELAGELLGEMSDGRYPLMELDEEYNIRIFDRGQFYGIERFSGGEKDLANLCLRLAISLALTESAGLDRSFVILDEVFGSQDDSRRELIVKGLTGLKNRFPQILLITHIAEIKDRVEQVYDVWPTGQGWSEVKVNGGA